MISKDAVLISKLKILNLDRSQGVWTVRPTGNERGKRFIYNFTTKTGLLGDPIAKAIFGSSSPQKYHNDANAELIALIPEMVEYILKTNNYY